MQTANEELGLDIRYWAIGNEPELYGDYDTARYNQEWRAIAEAMLAFDPEIILIGPDVTKFTGNPAADPRDENGLYWIEEFLKQNGDLVDIVSIHRYPFTSSLAASEASREQLYQSVVVWETIIPALRSKILEHTGKELPVAVTEVNSHWTNVSGQEASPDSFANAVWWADVLSRMIMQDVEVVTYFSLQSNANIGSYGLFERYGIRPTYYVYLVFKGMGQTRVYASSSDADVTLLATRCADNDIAVLFVNRAMEDKQLPLEVKGSEALANLRVVLLTEEIQAEEVSAEDLIAGQPSGYRQNLYCKLLIVKTTSFVEI